MPLPLYAPPAFRSSREPNPFARTQPERLRVLIDRPLVTGPVDGDGDYQGYPFLGSGSIGYPDAAAVLRSFLGHDALEVLRIADELKEEGDVVLGEPHAMDGHDTFSFQVRRPSGTSYNGIYYYQQAVDEAAAFTSQHGISAEDGYDGAMYYRIGAELEADLVVTGRRWLLAERGRPHGKSLARLASPDEALALIGLYLRWHRQYMIVGGSAVRWHPTEMRHSAAYTAMPAFERWNQAGRTWHDRTPGGDLTIEHLNQTLLTRISRTLQFRDGVFALSATMDGHEPEEMLCELDSLLFSLVGAFDVAARITDRLLQINDPVRKIGWPNLEWHRKLEPIAKDLYDYTAGGTQMHQVFKVLRWLRNSVHNEALDLTTDNKTFYLTIDAETQDKLRGFLREGHTGWTTGDLGIRVQPPGGATAGKRLPGTGRHSVTVRRSGAPRPADPLEGRIVIDVRKLINKIFPECLTALDQIMRLTPLTRVPGYHPGLDDPSRVNLPWQYSDTTGHRVRFLYGLTELG
jgi:hypothetical protein